MTNLYNIESSEIIGNGLIIKGPDNKLGVYFPLEADTNLKPPVTKNAPNSHDNSDALSRPAPPHGGGVQPPALTLELKMLAANVQPRPKIVPKRHASSEAEYINRGAADWIAEQDDCFWTLRWKLGSQTTIRLCDYGDGPCYVTRSFKPPLGAPITDRPLSDRSLAECMQHIARWVEDGPQSWMKFDDRPLASKEVKRRLAKRLLKRR